MSASCMLSQYYYIGVFGQAAEECEPRGIDLVFVLDSSFSIRRSGFIKVIELVRNLIANLDIGLTESLVGVIRYSTRPQLLFSLLEHTDKTSLLQAIDAIKFERGRTHTGRALELLLTSAQDGSMGLRDGHPHIAVVITDGISYSKEGTLAAARDLHDARVYNKIISVGTADYRTTELQFIADDFVNLFIESNFTSEDIEVLQHSISLELCADESKC